MHAVSWSDEALHDFKHAIGYIAQDDQAAAALVADRIDAAINGLADMPLGHAGRVAGTYEKMVLKTPYIVAYALLDELVVILRVIHTSRDWQAGRWPE